MTEKQLRLTNILLVLILITLLINLVVDLLPYIITGRLLGSFFTSNKTSPMITFSTQTLDPEKSPLFFLSTQSP